MTSDSKARLSGLLGAATLAACCLSSRHALSIVFIALVFLMGAPTHSFATTECSVKKTPDGFVALRKEPSQKAPIIARLKPKDVVLISSEHEPSGRWIYVSKVRSNGKYGPSGWVNLRLIDDDMCG
jgi:hypothetical protein